MSVNRTAKTVQKDFLAYEMFKEILKRAEPNKEIWPIALKLCHYCISLDCNSGDQCPQKVLHESEQYAEDVFLRRTNVYSLCLRYDNWLSSKQNKLRGNKNEITEKGLKFECSDLKEIAECMFQDLYTRAVDETYDHLNVIYFYHRLCNYCNRFECCDKDQTCNFKPVFDKSKNYRAFKEFERQELEIQMQNYFVRHKVSKEVVDKYRSTKNELKKYPIVDILNAKPKEVESRPVLVGNNVIGNEKSGLIDNGYENTSIHDSNQEMNTEILTSNSAPVSEKETAENFLFCNATYNDYRKEILFSCENNFKNECYHLNANEIKKYSKAFLYSLTNKTKIILLLLFLISMFGIFEIPKRTETLSLNTYLKSSDVYSLLNDQKRQMVLNETALKRPHDSCANAYQFDCSEQIQSLSKFHLLAMKRKQLILRLYLVITISLIALLLENSLKIK
jgi:hypothetical protein